MTTLLCVSVTKDEAARLQADGPRRDFVEVARAVDGELLYRDTEQTRRGIWGRLMGPHLHHAWRAAARVQRGDVVFADGEHVGLPLLAFLAMRRRRPGRVVVLGHLPGRWWKRLLFAAVTRLGPPGRLLVHSRAQADLVAPALGGRWEIVVVPYQVDSAYWQPRLPRDEPAAEAALLLAVGSEHRDYETLVRAVEGLPVRLLIAAGSHWARRLARPGSLPSNVEYLDRPLPFHELRERYAVATAVVVPVVDVPNQSGVTTILEAMSMGLPVITSTSSGQRETVRGPLVTAGGRLDWEATADRGPADARESGEREATGLYVPVADAAALRAAIELVLGDTALRERIGGAARASVDRDFTVERFAERFAAHLSRPNGPIEAEEERVGSR